MRFTFGSAPLGPLETLEVVLTLICILLAFIRATLGGKVFPVIESKLRTLSKRPVVCTTLLFVLPILLRLLLLPVYGPPKPFIHDEYAYLLQADTFSSGRLTNQTPPFASHFTSVYVLTQPTYTAEYQPAQGMMLALGQALTGHPWAGSLLSIGLFFVALHWALRAWLSPAWAFTGTLIIEISIGVLGYWTNSYWGGAVPGIGGALVLGSLPRVRLQVRTIHSFALALGISILVYSRPLEGLLLALLTAGALSLWLLKREHRLSVMLARLVLPMAAVFVPAVLFGAYYNARVTGRPTKFPYLLYRAQYGLPQGFFWQGPLRVNNSLPVDIQAEYDSQMKAHERRKSVKGLVLATAGKVRTFWEFYIGVPLTVTLFFLPGVWRGRNKRLAALALLLVLGFENLTYFAYFPHYSAAVSVAIYLVVIECLRGLRSRRSYGLFLSRALPLVCLVGLLIPVGGRLLQSLIPAGASKFSALWNSEFENWISREQFTPDLNASPDRHLVFVRYNPRTHQNDDAWVYNRADLENAKVIWARELDPESNQRVMSHFAGRKVWLAMPDEHPQRLIPFDNSEQQLGLR